jgi:hypothetical protein
VLRDSWPLTPSQWTFVNLLKESEIAEQKVFSKDRVSSPAKQSSSAINSTPDNKGPKPKKKETKTTKQDTTKSRPQSSQFDGTKPHWTLRIMSDTSNADDIDIKKDTERIEEIKAMKRAWEASAPGRGTKAIQARLDFLKTHLIRLDNGEEEEKTDGTLSESQQQQTATSKTDPKQLQKRPTASTPANEQASKTLKTNKKANEKQPTEQVVLVEQLNADPSDEILLNRPPTPPKPKAILPQIDLAALSKSTKNERYYKDEKLEKQLAEERKKEIEDFIDFRDAMNKLREEIRINNKMEKIKQIEEAENLQVNQLLKKH